MADGLAMSSNRPQLNVFSTFGAFFEGIAREGFEMWRYQRNLNGINEGLNVTFHLTHVGACTGRDHFSGWSLDWINLALSYMPYLHRFYAPADARSAFVAIRDLAAHYGGHIIGIPRDNLPILTKQDQELPLWEADSPWEPVTLCRSVEGAKKAILAIGAPAYLAADAFQLLKEKGSSVDVYIVNGLPLESNQLADLFEKYTEGIVTIEDGIIGTRATGLLGFAGLISSAAYDFKIPLAHIGIKDPRIAPSDGHLEVWEHFGLTTEALVSAVNHL
jgi:transketolase C-terminal domain/subunit